MCCQKLNYQDQVLYYDNLNSNLAYKDDIVRSLVNWNNHIMTM